MLTFAITLRSYVVVAQCLTEDGDFCQEVAITLLTEVKGTASSSSSSQNMAFVSSSSSTNEVNTAYGVSTANTQVSPASTQVSTASTQVSTANLSDDTLALLSMRTRRFFKKTGRKITINGSGTTGYDKSKVECFNYHKIGHFARECRGPRNQDSRNRNQDSSRRTVNVEESSSKAMVAIDGAGFDWSYMADEEVPTNMALMVFSDSERSSNSLEFESYGPKSVSEDIFNEVRESLDASLVEELVSNDKLEKKTVFTTVAKMEFVRPKQQEKPVRKPVKYAEIYSLSIAASNCNYHQRERVVSENNYTRVNYNYSKKAHPSAHRNMVPRVVLIKTGLRSLNTARHVNTAHPKTIVYSVGPMSHFSKSAQSTGKSRIILLRISAVVNVVRANQWMLKAHEGTCPISQTSRNLMEDMLPLGEEPKERNILMCDKKNSVLFTDTGCFVLSPDFKLADESQNTPQQNGVAKRRNRTLIEAARTMLADSKVPTTFWAKVVNTACYVQNRALVVKPYNKTPYELFRGRTPALSFMRPFGCHVTILNTLDYLGKFDGNSDEGFFVGYSMNSKAFRVYNIRTKKVEENLHIRFLEEKPIIAGDGPKWLFDIDVLTKSMDYVLVVAGTNSNDFVSTEESISRGHFNKETGSSQDYILMPMWKDGSLFDSSSKNASNDEPQPSSDAGKKDDEGVNKESGFDDQERPKNSTQDVNTAGPSINTTSTNFNTGSLNINIVSPTVTTAPLEATHADFFGDETEVDMSNITTTYPVPSTPNTRIHKDYSLDHVFVLSSLGTARRLTKTTNEQGKSQKGNPSIKGPRWIEAMQEELMQFKNKKDERGIVIRNKARLVAQGYTQEEGIDYDEVFAPVVRIKAIWLFLAYASFKDFIVYQINVKSAFLYGKIEEEVYVCQPLGFEDPEFTDRIYKVEKALYGLHQAPRAWYETLSTYLLDNGFQRGQIDKTLFIKKVKSDILLVQVYVDDIIFGSTKKKLCSEFEKLMPKKFQMSSMGELTFFLGLQVTQKDDGIFISQDKYVDEILKKFGFLTVKTASTPMETSKPLLKDTEAEDVDIHLYRSMIGSLMYLTSLRPDIIYLKGQPKLGLWYPKDSPFDLEAYSDSDYAGASLDRKSTTGVRADAVMKCCDAVTKWVVTASYRVGDAISRLEMDLETAQTTTTAKLPILKQGEYDMWRLGVSNTFKYKDYLSMGCLLTTEDKVQKKNDVKAMNHKEVSENSSEANDEYFSAPSNRSTLDSICNRASKDYTMSFDGLYNNFKIVEQEVKGATSSNLSSSSQNMAFVSSLSSTNEVNTAYRVSTANTKVSPASTQVSTANLSDDTVYAFLASQPNGSQLVYEDLEQIHKDDIEEMDLKWQLTLLSMRTRGFFQKTGRKITINGSDTAGYDKSKVECFNCHKMRHFARECRGYRNQDSRNRNQYSSRRTVDGAGFDWSYMADDEVPTNMALMAFSDSKEPIVFSRDIHIKDSEISMLKSELEYRLRQEIDAIQLYWKTFDNASKSLDKLIGSQITDKSRKGVGFWSSNSLSLRDMDLRLVRVLVKIFLMRLGNLMMQELVSDDKLEKKTVFPTVAKIEFVRPKQQEKPVRKLVKNMVPRAVLMKIGLRSLNTARLVNTAHPKTTVYSARPMSHFLIALHCKEPINKKKLTNKNYSQKVNTVKGKFYTARPKVVNTARPNSAVVNAVRANQVNVVKASACWVWRPTKLNSASITLKRHNYVDARGRSKHMTGNMSYLSYFKEFDGGYVTFGGGAKGGKITGKGTLKTADESQVLLKVPRKNNMYSVDMKNIVPKECLTCLVAKATLDESMLWHRRLGHVNFKTINKLVKENLVRGLPSKRFKNDQTCVACLKGKQHKASCIKSNDFAGIEESIGAGHSSKEIGSSQDYILTPLWKDGSLFDSSSKNASNDEPQPSSDAGKKDDEGVNKESGIDDQERPENSTQDVNAAGPSINTASTNVNTGSLNINTSGVLTRRMTKTTNEQGFISAVYEGKTHEDLHTCLFACFLSQEEPKKVIQALKDPSWIEVSIEELMQFKFTTKFGLGGVPLGKRAIGTKWVYRNKKDERGIVIRNKARLVAQGYTQEEGIDS
ncbi:putative ribonuclease H-like domain-containing protein [Tanacetum coccineum]